jgi:hypothetical protein
MRRLLLLLIAFSCSLSAYEPYHFERPEPEECYEEPSCFQVSELGIGSGYTFGHLDTPNETFQSIPLFLHLGFDLNDYLGCPCDYGTLQLAFQPFWNAIIEPDTGIETGLSVKLFYSYPVYDCWELYLEAGAGPGYLSIETEEQGDAGFNFFDEGGLGIKYFYTSCCSANLGYRIRHVSHAGLRSGSNDGIDSHAIMLWLSSYY